MLFKRSLFVSTLVFKLTSDLVWGPCIASGGAGPQKDLVMSGLGPSLQPRDRWMGKGEEGYRLSSMKV